MTEPIFELRFQELIGERPIVKEDSRSAVIFLQALFDVAGDLEFALDRTPEALEIYKEDEAA